MLAESLAVLLELDFLLDSLAVFAAHIYFPSILVAERYEFIL